MKLNPYDIELQDADLARLNTADTFRRGLSADDAKLSAKLPIVIKYDYVDLGVTKYHFKQKFELRDTQAYFSMMKELSSKCINDFEGDRSYHFYRSNFSGNIRKAVKSILPNADEDLIVYHFGLYNSDKGEANRKTEERSPRVYFLLGNNGHVYVLFFDPYHELNPLVK